jgi:PAS domain S-box-containing protein
MVQLFAEAGFNAVFDSSGEALVVVDSTGVIQKANQRARDLLRLLDSGMEGARLEDFVSVVPTQQLMRLWADPTSPRILDTSLASGFPIRITLRSLVPGSQNLLLCLEEGSVVHRADAKWRQAEAELRSVLDSVQTGILLVLPSGRIRLANARYGQLFGLSPAQLEKLTDVDELEELFAGRFREPQSFCAPWKSFQAGRAEPSHDELEITRPARRVLERFSRPVIDAEGRPLGWLELYSDVTGQRQIQSKVLQTEKMAALGQLVSGIAHELNNPLTAIMGYAQLLLGHGLMPAQLSEAGMVYQEAERARRIVKNLLYFARQNKTERTHTDLNEIVERTLALRSYELKMENIVVQCELSPDLPKTMADPYQLQQVILNLIVNAEQALLDERGRGRIWIRTYSVVRRDGDWISLEVSDDGPGIPPEIASRIFDPFFTTKPPGVGTGLGLSIVYGIVQKHNGEVTFENQSGSGAKFLVELPVVPVPAEQPAPLIPQLVGESGVFLAGRILVVEDEPTVAHLIVDILREEGHQVEAVLDSRQGLVRLSRGHYDLVICDLRMPRLDGFGFYEELVRSGSPVQNSIIFITGDTLAPRTLEFLEPNGLPYLAKPFLVEELKLAVSRMLDPSRKARLRASLPARRRPGRRN